MYYRTIKILSFFIVAEALLVMGGWVFNIDRLTRIFPNQGVNMAFPTAVMFFLSAVGIYFIYRTILKNDYSLSQVILPGISLLLFLIDATVLVSSIIGIHTGLENLFVHEINYKDLNTTIAGLPAIPTMVNFFMFGLASIFFPFTGMRYKKFIKFFGYFILITGLIAIIGYVFDFSFLYYKFSSLTIPMAFNTAITFILLGYALVLVGRNKNNEA